MLPANQPAFLFCLALPHFAHAHSHTNTHSIHNQQDSYLTNYLFQHPLANVVAAVSFVAIVPFLLLSVLPQNLPRKLVTVLLAFAVGAVLGDVFLHQLPEAFEGTGHHHHSEGSGHHDDNEGAGNGVGLAILAGIIVFFALEKIVRSVAGGHGHSHEGHSHSHHDTYHDHIDHHHEHEDEHEDKDGGFAKHDDKENTNPTSNSSFRQRKTSKNDKAPSVDPTATTTTITTTTPKNKTRAYLNVLAAIAHSYGDGLALCLSFLSSPTAGISTSLAIFFHEIPHKLSSYAILRSSSFTKKQSLALLVPPTLGTILGALTGAAVYLFSDPTTKSVGSHPLPEWIMPFTAGGLIYLAFVGVMPELVASEGGVGEVVMQLFGIGLGVWVMAIGH